MQRDDRPDAMAARCPTPGAGDDGIEVFACVREIDRAVLATNLHRSPEIASGAVPCTILWNTASAAIAYNGALSRTTADIVVFAHSDVYFPAAWFATLREKLARLSQEDPAWAIAGLIGRDATGALIGRLWDVGLDRFIGVPPAGHAPIVAIDEFVMILRRSQGLTFDEGVPDFHCYGADLIFEAEGRGLTSYALDHPVIHNSKPVTRLPKSFAAAYHYVRAKWRDRLPRYGIVVDLTRGPWLLWYRAARIRYKGTVRASTLRFERLDDPRAFAQQIGLEAHDSLERTA